MITLINIHICWDNSQKCTYSVKLIITFPELEIYNALMYAPTFLLSDPRFCRMID